MGEILSPPEYAVPICPVCGEECDTLYVDKDGTIFGCDECVKTEDAWLWKWKEDGNV